MFYREHISLPEIERKLFRYRRYFKGLIHFEPTKHWNFEYHDKICKILLF